MYEKLSYFSAKKQLLENKKLSTFTGVNISVLRNVTVEQIEVFLKYFCAEFSIKVNCNFGGFNTIVQDVLTADNDLISSSTDVALVFYNVDFAYPNLKSDYHQLTAIELEIITNDVLAYVEACISAIRSKSDALILWPSFESYFYTAFGIKDSAFSSGLNDFITSLNTKISFIFANFNDCYFIKTDNLCAKIGEANFYDHIRCISSGSPYSISGLKTFALEFSKYVRALTGKVKKCIILDCDNTLWKGIVGESELSALLVGQTGYPSEAFHKFQLFVHQLSSKGVIVALCSKNNEEDVWRVFNSHPGMVLQKKDITTYRINWLNKADNIKEISYDLNLGLDSFVFIDDSQFECNLIIETLPEVDVIQMRDNPLEVIREVIERGLFDQYTITDEDKKRKLMYAGEVKRKKNKANIINLQQYLKSLKIKVSIVADDVENIPRISQLTQKTNQFNCTTKRYSEANISAFMSSNDTKVFSLQVKDKFGDLGIVGVIITDRRNESDILIDTFLMSCRALGREIENIFLSAVCLHFKQHGTLNITSTYIPTQKNIQVSSVFINNGFLITSKTDNLTTFLLELTNVKEKKHIFDKVEMINGK
jgi:FkbH-like protein